MSDFTRISSQSADAREQVAEQTREQRAAYITNGRGDKIGNNYTVEKGDFGHFLGYKPPTPEEAGGRGQMSGSRVIEVALQKEMAELGEGAAKHGNAYRNIHIGWGRYANEPGRERDMIKDGLEGLRQGPEKDSMESRGLAAGGAEANGSHLSAAVAPYMEQMNKAQQANHNDNIKYLEMQYKFQEMSKQDSTISNLMKVRHDAITRTIRGNQ